MSTVGEWMVYGTVVCAALCCVLAFVLWLLHDARRPACPYCRAPSSTSARDPLS